jgi:hypothetical protein
MTPPTRPASSSSGSKAATPLRSASSSAFPAVRWDRTPIRWCARGKFSPGLRAGPIRKQKALARQAQAPVQSSADHSPEVMHPPVHTVHRVQAQLYELHGAEHEHLNLEDLKLERWNIYMPRWLRRLIEAEAAATRRSPSQVLQDMVKAWAESR